MIRKQVAIIMGSDSDWPIMQEAATILSQFEIKVVSDVVSAHRTPEYMYEFASNADTEYDLIIAGAGGAAHLPGMMAALCACPVIGVPIKSSNSLDGWDSILSILQMPNGVPVATVALNAAKNAGLLALQILGVSDPALRAKIQAYKNSLKEEVAEKRKNLKQ